MSPEETRATYRWMTQPDGEDRPLGDFIEEVIREEMKVAYCAAVGIPMDLIDGRPWVRRHDEAHPAELWGDGNHGCGHADCGDTAGRNLTGLLGAPGVTS